MQAKAKAVKESLFAASLPEKADFLPYFFKTGKGQYGEGDKFMGVVVPKTRAIVKQYKNLPFSEIEKLLQDVYHECRLAGLLFLVSAYQKANTEGEKEEIYRFYVNQFAYVNNWDLVDLSCYHIIGEHLLNRDRLILQDFARSEHLWTERIAMVSTYAFIRKNQFKDTFIIADILQTHTHDLIHKAVGWMLREAGKRNFEAEYEYLLDNKRYLQMPRTMLRYAIEKFPEEMRQDFLKGRV